MGKKMEKMEKIATQGNEYIKKGKDLLNAMGMVTAGVVFLFKLFNNNKD